MPVTQLDAPYSSPEAKALDWATVEAELERAGVYWISTVRPDTRPHVTPVAAVWHQGSLYVSTGPQERKWKNLAQNSNCVITTGCNAFDSGLDVVIEGVAARVGDEATLQVVAALFASKYDDHFGFEVAGGAFVHSEGGVAHVYEVAPVKAFAYGRTPFSATRYRFR